MPLTAHIANKNIIMMEIYVAIIVESNEFLSGNESIRCWKKQKNIFKHFVLCFEILFDAVDLVWIKMGD